MEDPKLRRRFLRESLLRNAALLATLGGTWGLVRDAMAALPREQRADALSLVGLLLAGSVAGAFAFSSSRTDLGSPAERALAHLTRLALDAGIGLLLQAGLAVMELTPGPHNTVLALGALSIYLAVLVHDAWDALCPSRGL